MNRHSPDRITELNTRLVDPAEVLGWAVNSLHPRVALASSFGAEDVVIIDMMCRLGVQPRLFTLDTGRLNPETFDVMQAVRERYRVEIRFAFPEARDVRELVRAKGVNLFYASPEDRRRCCEVRKVRPLAEMLRGLDGWITGLRRQQTPQRTSLARIEIDDSHGGIFKFNPLLDWSSDDVWSYIREHEVPYNKLHDAGYPSIGCAPCTRAVGPGEDLRAGRWWWETGSDRECGIHVCSAHGGAKSWDATD